MYNISKERIESFLNGDKSLNKIVKIETSFESEDVFVVFYDENNVKKIKRDKLYPFIWTTRDNANKLFNGERKRVLKELDKAKIRVEVLKTKNDDSDETIDRLENGYSLLFYSVVPMSNKEFFEFFTKGGRPVYSNYDSEYEFSPYMKVNTTEMYLIKTGNRYFKGFEDYDDLHRMQWDIETEGLDHTKHRITQIGVRTNKGFNKIIKIDHTNSSLSLQNELSAIKEFLTIIKELKPDIISGHNSENFDWTFIIEALKIRHNTSIEELSNELLSRGNIQQPPIFKNKRDSVLKLGGEVEYFKKTNMWGYCLTDSIFAVRRAQAIDSNMESASLKYITKYSKLVKPNRVYVDGKKIDTIWKDTSRTYLLNDLNGQWFKLKDEDYKNYKFTDDIATDENGNEFMFVTGTYIVERYLYDDLYETDKVELQYNQPNFLVGKMIPVCYEKMCTMGTAAIWKYMMLAWCFENKLAIPSLINRRKFTGGLSRLFEVGFVKDVAKFDYNSLYPSIILSMGIKSKIDISNALPSFLEYFLTQREYYKELKGKHSKKANKLKEEYSKTNDTKLQEQISENQRLAVKYDKLQLPIKIIANAYFGSFGSGSVFPFSDIDSAEEVTCTGRMMFRLMAKYFRDKGYKPIVGDSFTKDTPLFIKYNDTGYIDIKPVCELINEDKIEIDDFEREYDLSKKDFKVLCRSGWVDCSYIYRHKTDKTIHRVIDNGTIVDVTDDHSLFNEKKQKIKPNEIDNSTKLEYMNNDFSIFEELIDDKDINLDEIVNEFVVNDVISYKLLNCSKQICLNFIQRLQEFGKLFTAKNPIYEKTNMAKFNFIINRAFNGL